MASTFDAHGYEDLRLYARNAYTHVAVIDDAGNEVTRLDVDNDPRLINSPDPTTNPLVYQFELEGSDSDIPNPVTFTETRLYENDTETTPIGTDTMKDATIEADGDTLTISHEIQIP